MILSKRSSRKLLGTPVSGFLSPNFPTTFSIPACDGLQRTQALTSWVHYLAFPSFPKTTLTFLELAPHLVVLVLALRAPKTNLLDWFKAVSFYHMLLYIIHQIKNPSTGTIPTQGCSQALSLSFNSRSGHIVIG